MGKWVSGVVEEGGPEALGADRGDKLRGLILDALRRQAERIQLGHIATGHTSEGAAGLVNQDMRTRLDRLQTDIDSCGGLETDAALAAPGEPGQTPPPGQQLLPGQTPPNPADGTPPATPNPEGL